MPEFAEASNYHQTRRHYSADLAPAKYGKGLEGTSLCTSANMPTKVYDQEWQDIASARYGGFSKAKKIADLPQCKSCARRLVALKGTP